MTSTVVPQQAMPVPEKEIETTRERLIYYSSASGNTHRFITKLNRRAARIPMRRTEPDLVAETDYVLLVPTYGGTKGERSILPQILNFLREPQNRKYLRGVMGAGNSNFGAQYNIAARKIAAKLDVPLLYTFEIMGTEEDVARVNEGLDEFWTHLSLNPQ
ncbi:class Ib ribonucleoside-diphosphate reductase assembly flavoprotein NrdI [Pseudoglutamicibacter cumminsii]